jgi:glycosyltransferase involved in cell wall biosynthesis
MGKSKSNHQKKKQMPFVSVICVTYNRRPFFPTFFKSIALQDYPHSRFEVIIVDDGTDKIKDLVEACGIPQVKYFELSEKMPLGKKRNYSHTLVDPRTKYITYFDDDDYQHPQRISHSVEMLEKNPQALCAGSSELYVYFKHIKQMYQFGPYGPNHATAGTFMFRKDLLDSSHYQDTACLAEEKHFLKNYTVPFVQLNPLKNILVFSHEHNTFDKRKLLEQGPNPYSKPSDKTIKDFITMPAEDNVYKFFVEEIDGILKHYDPGDPKHKPDVLRQIKEIEIERARLAQQHQQQQLLAQQQQQTAQIMLERPGQPPIALNAEQIMQIIKQQQGQMEMMANRIKVLEEQNKQLTNILSQTNSKFDINI